MHMFLFFFLKKEKDFIIRQLICFIFTIRYYFSLEQFDSIYNDRSEGNPNNFDVRNDGYKLRK